MNLLVLSTTQFGFLAPHCLYTSNLQDRSTVAEFKTMVRSLHEVNIAVILNGV
nr:hypothetical protein [Mycobacterium lepromatosis]